MILKDNGENVVNYTDEGGDAPARGWGIIFWLCDSPEHNDDVDVDGVNDKDYDCGSAGSNDDYDDGSRDSDDF